jgi:hypothetical protein
MLSKMPLFAFTVPVNTPLKFPSVALIIPLISALDATSFPSAPNLNPVLSAPRSAA